MTLYELYDYGEEEAATYFPTLKEARQEIAERDLDKGYGLSRVRLIDLPPRQLACRLLLGESFIAEREELEGAGPF